jgi:hypothetical protein
MLPSTISYTEGVKKMIFKFGKCHTLYLLNGGVGGAPGGGGGAGGKMISKKSMVSEKF